MLFKQAPKANVQAPNVERLCRCVTEDPDLDNETKDAFAIDKKIEMKRVKLYDIELNDIMIVQSNDMWLGVPICHSFLFLHRISTRNI